MFSSTLFCSEYIKKYSAIKKWESATENLGNSIYELKIKEKTGTEIKAELFHTVTPFSQVISNEINLKLNNGKYEFSFVDGWNNRAFGWIVFYNDYLEIYLDCNEFDEQGKNVARLYGETIRLYETTKDKDFINNAIESDYSVKKILNNLKIPKTTIGGLDTVQMAFDSHNCNWVSLSGGGDPLFGIDNEYNKLKLRLSHSSELLINKKEDDLKQLKNNHVFVNPNQFIDKKRNLYFKNFNKLEVLNPLLTLKRGYTLTKVEGKVVSSSKNLKKGDKLEVKFTDGSVNTEVL